MRMQRMESARTRGSSAGATAASLLAHVAVIGMAAHAALGASAHGSGPNVTVPTLIFVPAPIPAPVRSGGGERQPPKGCDLPDGCRPFPLPRNPFVDAPILQPAHDPVIAGPAVEFPTNGIPGTRGGGENGIAVEIAEELAIALAGNPLPVYPSLLRATRVAGIVNTRFVVDTTGRVESASITFDEGSDRLFQESVRRALLASRFRPARNAGRRVRILVRQDFVFRLTS